MTRIGHLTPFEQKRFEKNQALPVIGLQCSDSTFCREAESLVKTGLTEDVETLSIG